VVVYKGFVYGLSDGILECAELATGKRQWKSGHYGHGQILRVRELLLVETEEGEIVLVELTPESHRELGRFLAIDGKTWNNLCLFGRYLLVRNSGEAACYELTLAQ
jgi:outer membrane protein assembly factor BamB